MLSCCWEKRGEEGWRRGGGRGEEFNREVGGEWWPTGIEDLERVSNRRPRSVDELEGE